MGWIEQRAKDKWRGAYRDRQGVKHYSPAPYFMYASAAQSWADEHQAKVDSATWRDPRAGRMLLRDFVPEWLDARVVEHTTRATDTSRLAMILAQFGDIALQDIGPLAIRRWLKQLGATRAPGTVAKYLQLLSAIMQDAVLEERITTNPCRNLATTGADAAREVYLSHVQVAAVLDQLAEPHRTIVHTLAYTGLRWGELAGLHKPRVDFLRRTLTVAETLSEVGRDRRLKPYPKGKKPRVVPMPQHLVAALAEHLAAFPARPCGLPSTDPTGRHRCGGLMFTVPGGRLAGEPLSRYWWARSHLHPAVRRANEVLAAANKGLPEDQRTPLIPTEVRVHDLRHTSASWQAQAGTPLRVIQYRLGHASITTTERYSHFLPGGDGYGLAGLEGPGIGAAREGL